jgi:hypothetical protein
MQTALRNKSIREEEENAMKKMVLKAQKLCRREEQAMY